VRRPEQALQIAVAQFLRYALRAPSYWTSIDHGAGKMTPASAGLRKARGVQAGISDVLVMHPIGKDNRNGTRAIWIELKAGKGRTSVAQNDFLDRVLAAGCFARVARSVEEVDAILRGLGIPVYAKLWGSGIKVPTVQMRTDSKRQLAR
jgi:hypothetical protein